MFSRAPSRGTSSSSGFDISCGVRTLLTNLTAGNVAPVKERLAEVLFRAVPAGVGSTVPVHGLVGDVEAPAAGQPPRSRRASAQEKAARACA